MHGHLLFASDTLSSLPAVVLNVPSQTKPQVLAGVTVPVRVNFCVIYEMCLRGCFWERLALELVD